MSFSPYGRFNISPVYEILEILKLNEVYSLEMAKFAYRRVNDLLPTGVARHFEFQNVRNTRTRRNNSSSSERVIFNTNFGAKSILKRSVDSWNEVPIEIKQAPRLKSFQRMLKSHLLLISNCS